MISVNDVISYSRDRDYMSGIERDQTRIKSTSEVFTPTELVQHLLNEFVDPGSIKENFLDPSCGDGQILSEILIKKMQAGMTHEEALKTIYGVDIMQDNVDECQDRLLCEQENLRAIVEQNIVCSDALIYDYKFKKPKKKSAKQKEKEQNERRLRRFGMI